MAPGTKTCFFIAPIGGSADFTRWHSDRVLKFIVKPALRGQGYSQVRRADQIDEPGYITNQIIRQVADADLVIADLSFENPNVYYELSLRHALERPFIQIIRHDHELRFNIAGMRTVQFDLGDPESIEAAKQGIRAQLKTLDEGMERIDTPISVAKAVKKLWEGKEHLDTEALARAIIGALEAPRPTGTPRLGMRPVGGQPTAIGGGIYPGLSAYPNPSVLPASWPPGVRYADPYPVIPSYSGPPSGLPPGYSDRLERDAAASARASRVADVEQAIDAPLQSETPPKRRTGKRPSSKATAKRRQSKGRQRKK
jgi:hypothetical protein